MSRILSPHSNRGRYLDRRTGLANVESQRAFPLETPQDPRSRPVNILFCGHDGEECEAFIHQMRIFALDNDKDDDPAWMARKASACFVESALRWHIGLDEQTRSDWTLLERALMNKYPEPDVRLSGHATSNIIPAAPSAASGAIPGTGSGIAVGDVDGSKASIVLHSAWHYLENDPTTVDVVASNGQLFQLLESGRILQYVDEEWQLLDINPATVQIVTDGTNLYQRHKTGRIWVYAGTPISGWTELDNNSATIDITASNGHLYQLQENGRVLAYNGTPYTGWQLLERNPGTAQIVADGDDLYQRRDSGAICHLTRTPSTGWKELDNNSATVDIVAAGGHLFQRHKVGVWAFLGTPYTWLKLDNNPATVQIVTDGRNLFRRQKDGSIWHYTGRPCIGWGDLDSNPSTVQILLDGRGQLYQRHKSGEIFKYVGNRM